MATAKIRAATLASPSELFSDLPTERSLRDGSKYRLEAVHSLSLSARAQDAIFHLCHANIAPLAEGSSLSYAEKDKREELFDPSTRFLLLLKPPGTSSPTQEVPPMPGALPSRKGKARAGELDFSPDRLLGFTSWRFDTEETLGTRDAEVVYCYEVHLVQSVRGQGLAKMLMDRLEEVGRRRGMDKVMLTCLRANTTALDFYARQGYVPDEIDPIRMAEDDDWEDLSTEGHGNQEASDSGSDDHSVKETDYRILSKSLKDQVH